MRKEGDELEEAVGEFLGKQPRAAKLAELRQAMEQRIEVLKAALARATEPAEKARVQKDLQTAERHLEALAREEMITEFVENSVRATASWSLLKPEDEEE